MAIQIHILAIFLLFLTLRDVKGGNKEIGKEDIQRFFGSFELYDKSQIPQHNTVVNIGFYISYLDISEDERKLDVKFYFRQKWLDNRFEVLTSPFSDMDYMQLEPETVDTYAWKPDSFFPYALDMKTFEKPTVEKMFGINATNHVFFIQTVRGTFPCYKQADDLKCGIQVEAYQHQKNEMEFDWLENAKVVDPHVNLPGYSFYDMKQENCTAPYTTGTYSCLSLDLYFSRL